MSNPLTPEDKLKAIIQAQCDGGYCLWKNVLYRGECKIKIDDDYGAILEASYEINSISVLQILLDTKGLKSAYGQISVSVNYSDETTFNLWQSASKKILTAWNSGEGNNWDEAINTAFKLLPN